MRLVAWDTNTLTPERNHRVAPSLKPPTRRPPPVMPKSVPVMAAVTTDVRPHTGG